MTVIGTRLDGRYRIEDRIGAGGMSTVYRAFDETLERQVAIKILHGHISEDAPSLERFRREARTVAQLSHPHVVMVIDAGEDEGHPYIVFEHVRGETLKERIRREGPLPVAEAVAYAIEIGRGLQAAHERSLVHRDVKPQNVLIDDEGRAKVTDFGIALGSREQPADGRGQGDRHDGLRLARAGDGPGGHRPVRRLLARHRALRDADGQGAVLGREPRERRDEAHPRGHAGRAQRQARGVGGARVADRARDRQGPARAVRVDGRLREGPGGGAGLRERPLRRSDRRGDRDPQPAPGCRQRAAHPPPAHPARDPVRGHRRRPSPPSRRC